MNTDLVPIIIIAVTAIISYMGFQNNLNNNIFNNLCFYIQPILGPQKQWYRLLSNALVHADMMHLLFNMLTLWFFAPAVVDIFGDIRFLILYAGSILLGSLVSLWIHRKQPYYRAVGASGGVIGVVFAMIAIDPQMSIYFFFIPIAIPAWLFGVAYLVISIYALQRSLGNIGHDAHIGGAIAGIAITLLYAPQLIVHNWIYLAINMLPVIYFLYYVYDKR